MPHLLPTILNHCNLSPWAISSWEFQDRPQPLELGQVHLTDRALWRQLAATDNAVERGRIFHDYMSVKFRLHDSQSLVSAGRPIQTYLTALRNWGLASNSASGAILKAWVESRFGLRATYHRGLLRTDPSAQERYALDRMNAATQMPNVYMQFDMLYTFCQDELARRFPGRTHFTLYRGTHDPEEYILRGQSSRAGYILVELNNLCSFTSDPEVAWEFGHHVWIVAVPLSKVLYFSGLIPIPILQGESEHLVLGGEYHVQRLRG